MAPSQFEKDEADREFIRDELTMLEAAMNGHITTALTLAQVEQYLHETEDTQRQLKQNHSSMRLHAPKATDMTPYKADYITLSATASRIYNGFHGIKSSFPPPTPAATSTAAAAAPPPQTIRLPALELHKFSGNLQEWVSFRDTFLTAVHNSSLSKVEKLTHLKSLVSGEAARQIRSLILCDANYDIAWTSLQERYENNRELLFSILKRLINHQALATSSTQGIRNLIDITKECIRSLEILKIPTQHWDAILLYLLFSKLDSSSRELWEQSLPDTSIPPLSKMYEFLEQRARALAASGVTTSRQQGKPQQQHQVRAHHVATSNCRFGCDSTHPYFRCPVFKNYSPQQRNDTVKKMHLCLNCLHEGHTAQACSSQWTCKICSKKHHTMLHVDNGRQQTRQQSEESSPSTATSHHITPVGDLSTGIIATARIKVINNSQEYFVRALVDGCSTNSYITKKQARLMNLKLHPVKVPLAGLENTSLGTAKHVTSFSFKPHINSMVTFSATALVVNEISGNIPSVTLKRNNWSHLDNLELADPDYHRPDKCDVLLGTEIFWSTLENEKISGSTGQPHGIKTSLGWLVAGPNSDAGQIRIFNAVADLDFLLRRFWEQESVSEEASILTQEEAACEDHFKSTHKRDESGRFIVSLPFKPLLQSELGASRQAAVKRFLSMERRFSNPNTKDAESLRKLSTQWSMYKDFMKEYEDLGHMKLIPATEVHVNQPTYYIPHHSVLKESSTTTKLRVVFDASAPTSTGLSLNDCLMVGPQLQDTIADIHLRFRTHLIVFTADIEKMYRQIYMDNNHINYQRIVWRSHPSEPLRDYWLLTVTYGEAPAPYQAVKCLQQLATDERETYPHAAKVALRDFYMDDNCSGCDTLDQAKVTVKQLIDLCMSGGFQLRKWTTNNTELLQTIPEHLRETKTLVELQTDATIKTLGVYWNPSEDNYLFRLSLPPDMPGKYTKRLILSEIARIYDPLGWLAPAIIVCKIFMQELWKLQINWDEIITDSVQDDWLRLKKSLVEIEKIQIPRCVTLPKPVRRLLVGCSDASTKAISSAVYFCCEYEDHPPTCYLLTSKTRVAPVKHVSLPRLELNGAVLLAELLQNILKALNIKFDVVRAFVDSTIALHWICSTPSRWKIYVRRRVQLIQDSVPSAQWYHIPGERNPADCASRGLSAEDLLHHPLWWNGVPEFFTGGAEQLDLVEDDLQHLQAEVQPVPVHHVQQQLLLPVFSKFESFLKLQRVMAYVYRFLNNARRLSRLSDSLTVQEMTKSHNAILKLQQQANYQQEYQALSKGNNLPPSSPLTKLKPFIGEDGLIRVGGRLRHAKLSFDRKHPILLPRSTQVTTSIIRHYHRSLLHAGTSAVLASLQQRYWLINGRDAVRYVLRRCVSCARHQATLLKQIMGDLPAHRVNPARPFSKVGVDYAGPISIRPMVRSKISLKCWLAIFVCFSTRAIHIEVVSSLSTDCFLAALRRFIARRGRPSDIFSDRGTNFKGSDKVLNDFSKLTQQQAIQDECSSQAITWHFNPAGAPHFGGLWEAGVKSIKYHMKRVMGTSLLTYEEMHTLVVQIEGILNSRPLIPASNDPSDLGVLTPGHFLIGDAITALPEPSLVDTKECYLKRWQLLQQRHQIFWKRWSCEYLSRLQQRPKWWKPSPNLEVGHLVVIKDERAPPLKWKMGRVAVVHPGADGHVRVATLKTAEGEITRPILRTRTLDYM